MVVTPALTSFKCSIHDTGKGILSFISIESLHTAGVIGVGIEIVEDKIIHTTISSLEGGE